MALDHQIAIAREHFGITAPEDWCKVRADWIRQLHGCGPETVNHLRIYLAARGLTLQDDATPDFWQRNLAAARIGGQVAESDTAVVAPFTVLIDTQEKQPFTFQGFRSDSSAGGRPLLVQTRFKSLGPTHGDYSIEGLERMAHVERKSMADAHGTFLSHGERRDRWLATLAFLAEIPYAAIVVECSLGAMLAGIEPRGRRSKSTLTKTLHRQVLAWAEDFRIPFHFCDARRLAEATTLAVLRRAYRKELENQDCVQRDLDTVIADL